MLSAAPALARELRGTVDTAQIYHELLERRRYLSARAQQDVGLEATVEDYVRDILLHTPKAPPVPD